MTDSPPQTPDALSTLADIGRLIHQFHTALAPIVQRFALVWAAIAPHIEEIATALRALPRATRQSLLRLAEHGWYLDPGMPAGAVFSLSESLSGDRAADTCKMLCQWVDDHLDEIEMRLTSRFPEREDILRSAFAAHRVGDYALSIPTLLAQADGICQQL